MTVRIEPCCVCGESLGLVYGPIEASDRKDFRQARACIHCGECWFCGSCLIDHHATCDLATKAAERL